MPPYIGVAMMILLGLAFAGASIVGAGLIRPKHPTPGKMDAYESGVPAGAITCDFTWWRCCLWCSTWS